MIFMMQMLAKQSKQMQQMQMNMHRELARENRELQREVCEESQKMFSAVPELIVKTISHLGLAYNVQPLMAVEGAPTSGRPLLLRASHSSRRSPASETSPRSDDKVAKQSTSPSLPSSVPSSPVEPLHVESELETTPTATLPAPTDPLMNVPTSPLREMYVDIPLSEVELKNSTDEEMMDTNIHKVCGVDGSRES